MILDPMIEQIKGKNTRIVLTEGEDSRILEAASRLAQENLLVPVLVGNANNISNLANELNLSLEKCELIDIETYEDFQNMVDEMALLRKGKQTREECEVLLKMPNYFGTMLVKNGMADGLVGGATYSTADTVRPALQLVKTKPESKTVSSAFLMYNEQQKFMFGDCAIIIDPSSEDLCEIAIESAKLGRLFGIDPKVAFLSYSTKSPLSGSK